MKVLLIIFIVFALAHVSLCQTPLSENFTRKDGLASNQCYDILYGTQGLIWTATSHGISAFNGLAFTNFSLSDTTEQIIGLVQDDDYNVWCYSSNARFFRVIGNELRRIEIPVSPQLQIINQVYIAKTKLWVAAITSPNITRFSLNGKVDSVISSEAKYIAVEINPQQFICGTGNNDRNILEVYQKNGPSIKIKLSIDQAPSSCSLIRLDEDHFLCSNSHELIRFDRAGNIQRTFIEKPIESIFVDKDQRVWVGLNQGGVLLYMNKTLDHNSKIHYLGNKSISGITQDNQGTLWLSSTSNGLYSLASNTIGTYKSPPLYSADNDNTESHRSIIAGSDIAVSDIVHSRVTTTDTLRYDTLPPTIFITGIQIMGQDTTLQDVYTLSYLENFVTFQFGGFSKINQEKLKYRYQMSGIDDKWIFSNRTYAHYTTLPIGNYTFEVRSMNNSGVWSEYSQRVQIIILPPFWKRTWFIVMILVMLACFIIVAMGLWARRVKQKQAQNLEIEKKISQIQLQALRAQMNPHFMFNTLSSIQHYITNSEPELAIKYLSKFAKLMRKILDNSKKPRISIAQELETLELYLQLEKLRFTDKFNYSITIDKSVERDYEEIPSMLIQPYVENALLHGLAHLQNKQGELKINVSKNANVLACAIEDNGIGRMASKKININRTHESSGMNLTKERLEILNNIHGSDLSVTIIDKVDDNNQPDGTKILIYIPNEHEED